MRKTASKNYLGNAKHLFLKNIIHSPYRVFCTVLMFAEVQLP